MDILCMHMTRYVCQCVGQLHHQQSMCFWKAGIPRLTDHTSVQVCTHMRLQAHVHSSVRELHNSLKCKPHWHVVAKLHGMDC